MKKYIFQKDAFFTDSPEIHIRRHPAVEDIVRQTKVWIEQQVENGGRMNCQTRSLSDEERDGHLVRLLGVQKMHAMLLVVKDQTDYSLKYYDLKKQWPFVENEHPCGMLAANDKWCMTSWNDRHLRRYGQERRDRESCVPSKMVGEHGPRWYAFAVEHCRYCNGGYDDVVPLVLGRSTTHASA
ncbi:unnamed protein product [Alternaria burnsii]|nr:unnamed protein product [Alternaria burnsii]